MLVYMERMRDIQEYILAPDHSLFSNTKTRSHLDSKETRHSSHSIFAVAESLRCISHQLPAQMILHAAYNRTWSESGSLACPSSNINFKAVTLLSRWGIIVRIDEHSRECPGSKDSTLQEDQSPLSEEEAKQWEERQWKQMYRMNQNATLFFPYRYYDIMRFISYSFPINDQPSVAW